MEIDKRLHQALSEEIGRSGFNLHHYGAGAEPQEANLVQLERKWRQELHHSFKVITLKTPGDYNLCLSAFFL